MPFPSKVYECLWQKYAFNIVITFLHRVLIGAEAAAGWNVLPASHTCPLAVVRLGYFDLCYTHHDKSMLWHFYRFNFLDYNFTKDNSINVDMHLLRGIYDVDSSTLICGYEGYLPRNKSKFVRIVTHWCIQCSFWPVVESHQQQGCCIRQWHISSYWSYDLSPY